VWIALDPRQSAVCAAASFRRTQNYLRFSVAMHLNRGKDRRRVKKSVTLWRLESNDKRAKRRPRMLGFKATRFHEAGIQKIRQRVNCPDEELWLG
jgi:hypothetical protein